MSNKFGRSKGGGSMGYLSPSMGNRAFMYLKLDKLVTKNMNGVRIGAHWLFRNTRVLWGKGTSDWN